MKRAFRTALLLVTIIAVLFGLQLSASAADTDLVFTLNSDNASYTVAGAGTTVSGDIIIPETYEGLPVTNIADKAFYDYSGITSVIIPDSVTTIGQYAFYRCSNLTEVDLGDGVTKIGNYAFSGCTKVDSVYIDSIDNWINTTLVGATSNPTNAGADFYDANGKVSEVYIPQGKSA